MVTIRTVLSFAPGPGRATVAAVVAVLAVSFLAAGGAIAAEDVGLEVAAGDVDVGDEYQSLALRLEGVEPGEPVDVYVNVTSLEAANVTLDDVGIEVVDAVDANVTDTEIVDENGTVVVRLSLDAGNAERAAVDVRLTGLDTGDADRATGLHHYAAVGDTERAGEHAPDGDDRRSASYDVVDPSEGDRGPHLQVSPGNVAIGSGNQTVVVRVAEAPGDFDLGIDITPLAEAGVGIDDADVGIDETHRLDATGATVTDGVVEIQVAAEDGVGAVHVRIVGVDTGDATPTEGLTYPVSVDGEPADPRESMGFDVFDPGRRDGDGDGRNGAETPTPVPEPSETPAASPAPDDPAPGSDDPAPGVDDGTTDTDDGTDDGPSAVGGPGFGPVATGVAALLAALFVRVVRE